jgi:hypothetical protein
MKQTASFLLPIAFVLMIIAPGCYTVVMHAEDEGGYRASPVSDCQSCHDYSDYPYGYYYSPYPSYWWDHADYGYYYVYPWWWSYSDSEDDIYYSEDGDYSSDIRGTKFDRRGGHENPLPPPYSFPHDGSGIIEPSLPNIPVTTGVGSGDQGTSGRPGTDTNDTGSRSKTQGTGETDSKEFRQSNEHPQPVPSGQVKNPDSPKRNNPPAETKDSQKGKKKSRKGGGGR